MPKGQKTKQPTNTGRPATLAGFNLGYNGYANPTMLSWKQWSDASNVYSGQHGKVIRARFAQVINGVTLSYTPQLTFFSSLFNFRDPTPQEVLLGDQSTAGGGGLLWSFNVGSQYNATQRLNPYFDPQGLGDPRLVGPWSRTVIFNTIFEMNGQVKQTGRGLNAATVEGWGLDSPDASPQVILTPGVIAKTVGRSYAFAWENVGKFNVGAPSPQTAFLYAGAQSQSQGNIQCIEAGNVTTTIGSTIVNGAGGAVFSPAWVGKSLWVAGIGTLGIIAAVPSATVLNLLTPAPSTVATAVFMIYDKQATHIRLYATADGGSTYFRTQRNQFLPSATTLVAAGLQFNDNDGSEPGAAVTSFTNEVAQFQNTPPPIGGYALEYQSRAIVFQVPGAPQTVFYSNLENTTIGNPPECFGPSNQFTLPIGDAQINGAAGLPTGLVLWSDRHDMFKITGTLQDNGGNNTPQQIGSQIQRLPYVLGCGSVFGTVVTNLGVLWITSDREFWLFTDNYAPRNVGRPIQDWLSRINPSRLFDARVKHVKRDDLNWVVLAAAIDQSQTNNKMMILDLDMMGSNGAPSFFVFDMSTNQPTWYLFDTDCEDIAPVFDEFGSSHLLAAGQDVVRDVTYRSANFAQIEESVGNGITLHALGNEDSHVVKEMDWIRFVTNQPPDSLQPDGWQFKTDAIDDDHFTFDQPKSEIWSPGVNSANIGSDTANPPGGTEGVFPGLVQERAFEFSPAKFYTRGIKSVQGRRIKISATFPNKPGVDYELLAVQTSLKARFVR